MADLKKYAREGNAELAVQWRDWSGRSATKHEDTLLAVPFSCAVRKDKLGQIHTGSYRSLSDGMWFLSLAK
jgi:hypothetical protein